MDNKVKDKGENTSVWIFIKDYWKWILLVIGAILLIPAGVAFFMNTSNPLIEIETTNDWIGFYGSYSGSIVGGVFTFIVLYFTRKDTRNIQYNIERKEEEEQLKAKRAFVDISLIKSGLFFHEYRDLLKEGRYFQNENYIKMFQYLESGFKNEEHRKNQEYLLKYNDYPYAILRNVSNNPMYHVEVNFLDTEENNLFTFRINTILPNENVLFSLLRINEINSIHYEPCVEKQIICTIEYETDYIGVRERVKINEGSIKYTKIQDDPEIFTDYIPCSYIVIDQYKEALFKLSENIEEIKKILQKESN